ncbi:MAG: radical SAM protein [Anaerolineae bacterium]
MTQRIYWVPHTVCHFGCLHCHNESVSDGKVTEPALIDRLVEHLPDSDSPYRLEEVLIGGGEGLALHTNVAHLVQALRERFPAGAEKTLSARRAAGRLILAIQTAGLPLADGAGKLVPDRVRGWVELGVDYFHVASGDMFHRSRQPRYPWDALEANMRAYGAETGVEFMIYGKEINRLVPSGRFLENREALFAQGATLLTDEGYCAGGWETGSHFLSGTEQAYPACSEVVIAPDGWVHPCCWYLLSPGLFDLATVTFEAGMQALRSEPYCQAIDRGDVMAMAERAGAPADWAQRVRAATGDCGLCRLASRLLTRDPSYAWLQAPSLSERERSFYRSTVADSVLDDLDA